MKRVGWWGAGWVVWMAAGGGRGGGEGEVDGGRGSEGGMGSGWECWGREKGGGEGGREGVLQGGELENGG